MAQPKIIYYPVGNGDQSLIILSDETTIMVDCNIRDCATNTDICDVKKDLLTRLKKRDNNPFVDVFILTHGDCDHCRGYEDHFYQGDPRKYSATDRKENRIIIDEMWFSPMIAEEHTNNDESAYQREAERRIALHMNGSADRDLPGNRIRIVGYDPTSKNYDRLNHLRATPGTLVETFNGKSPGTFSIFIHSPFKEHFVKDATKNSTSIVFQARFKERATSQFYSCLAMFSGDSDHHTWKVILDKTKKHGNQKNLQALNWDLFLAPHHCSWTFFNNTPQSENPKPTAHALEVLDYANANAKVIASSKKILDDDDNPPHYAAKQEYIKKLKSASHFINTSVEPSESDPEPLEFVITPNGPTRTPSNKGGGAITSGGGAGAASTIIKQG